MFLTGIFEYYIIITVVAIVVAVTSNLYYYLGYKWKIYECPNGGGWVVCHKGYKLVELEGQLKLVYIPHNLGCDSQYGTWKTVKRAEQAIKQYESLYTR